MSEGVCAGVSLCDGGGGGGGLLSDRKVICTIIPSEQNLQHETVMYTCHHISSQMKRKRLIKQAK